MGDAHNESSNDRKRKIIDDRAEVDSKAYTGKERRIVTGSSAEGGDPFLKALKDVQHALDQASAVGKARLNVVNQLYLSGCETGQDPSILDAQYRCETSMSLVKALTIDLSSKSKKAPVYKLPTEVMLLLFGYLDVVTLSTCQDTCRLWREILATEIARKDVWKGAPAILDANWKDVTKGPGWANTATLFQKMQERGLKPSVLALTIWRHIDRWKDNVKLFASLQHFPYEALREFRFMGTDSILWSLIARCALLKILHWTIWGHTYGSFLLDGDVPRCRLEELRFSSINRVEFSVDVKIVQMLSQVKRLHIDKTLGPVQLRAILGAAQQSLEELYVDGLTEWNNWIGYLSEEVKSSFIMEKLRNISIKCQLAGILNISAPHAVAVNFVMGALIDWTLLDSCRYHLQKLHIELKGMKTKGRFGQELFNMSRLEALHLDYIRDWNDKIYAIQGLRYEDYSSVSFWKAIRENDVEKVRFILPELKKLTIHHDPLLEESVFLQYIERRSLLDQPALEKVDIYLADHCSDNTNGLKALQTTMPGLTFKRFEEWSTPGTKGWFTKTHLSYANDIDWDEIHTFKEHMKHLWIVIHDDNVDSRLQQELFDIPQLEILHLDFMGGSSKVRSVAGLWAAYQTGETGKSSINMQDVLPRLSRLRVYNDSKLNADIIIKMVETRELLGMKAIESMDITLASTFSEDIARLKALEGKMHRCSFERREE